MTAPPDPIPGRQSHPPPDPVLVDGEEEYEVEAVINSCMFRGRLQYLIHWKGYSYEHNSWENAMEVHSPKLVAEFYSTHPRAPRQIHRAHFDYISFQSSQDRCAGSSLHRRNSLCLLSPRHPPRCTHLPTYCTVLSHAHMAYIVVTPSRVFLRVFSLDFPLLV